MILAIIKCLIKKRRFSKEKNNRYNTLFLVYFCHIFTPNKSYLKKIDDPTAVSFNKLQNSQTNGELV